MKNFIKIILVTVALFLLVIVIRNCGSDTDDISITINTPIEEYNFNDVKDLIDNDNKEFIISQSKELQQSLAGENSSEANEEILKKTEEKVKKVQKKVELEKEKIEKNQKKINENQERIKNSNDNSEIEKLKKENEELKAKIDESKNKLSDFDKFLQMAGRLAKIVGFACAATGNVQCSAVAFVIAAGIESDLASRGIESGGGPSKEETENIIGSKIPTPDIKYDSNTDKFDKLNEETKPISQNLQQELENKGQKLMNMESKSGDFRISEQGRLLFLYKEDNLLRTIDYFQINESVNMPSELGLRRSSKGFYRVICNYPNGEQKVLAEENEKWVLYN